MAFLEKNIGKYGEGQVETRFSVGSCKLLAGNDGINKNDIIKVISKYMEIDTDGLDIQITQMESDGGHGNVPAIYANIPIKELRSPR